MDQCHMCMYHRTVAWTSDVTYIFAIGLRALKSGCPSRRTQGKMSVKTVVLPERFISGRVQKFVQYRT